MGAVDKYLRTYADPQAVAIAERIERSVAAAVVVPARDESAEAIVAGLRAALADRNALAIVVVNEDADDPPTVSTANARLVDGLCGLGRVDTVAPDTRLVDADGSRWLVLHRILPPREGVGRARRLGLDLALSLWARGRLRRGFLDTTDADATLPPDAFDDAPEGAVALVRPFVHVPCGDRAIDEATRLYELTLRYWVCALAGAGSPWAMHTIGSCIAVHPRAYAEVRGVPIRAGGEDFHLLAKLAKLGPVVRGHGAPVQITTRASSRVPFGTGPAVQRIAETLQRGDVPRVYDPRSFAALQRTLDALDHWCESGARDPIAFAQDDPDLRTALDDLGAATGLVRAIQGATTVAARRRRAHEWLDALRTLRLVHRLRAHGRHDVAWPEALATLTGGPADVDAALADLRERERAHPPAGLPRP